MGVQGDGFGDPRGDSLLNFLDEGSSSEVKLTRVQEELHSEKERKREKKIKERGMVEIIEVVASREIGSEAGSGYVFFWKVDLALAGLWNWTGE